MERLSDLFAQNQILIVHGVKGDGTELAHIHLAVLPKHGFVSRHIDDTKERGTYVGPPKTGQPRAICLSPETIGVLKEYRTEQLRQKIRHADIWQDTGFLFTKDDGTPMHPDSITDWLNKFSEENDLPHIHPHAFRHTAASMMIANGVDLVNAAAELGHATASTTLNIYAHQVARARAEASGIRAGAFAVLRQA